MVDAEIPVRVDEAGGVVGRDAEVGVDVNVGGDAGVVICGVGFVFEVCNAGRTTG